jgi:hypothetical protein
MKLLLFYAHSFAYETASKGLPDVPDLQKKESQQDTVVVFYHVEAEDVEKRTMCGKFNTRNVVLHSFNHLSGSKADPDFSETILDEAVERLARTGYQVMVTPFGYFNEFNLHVAGDSLAKVFKEF